MYKVTLSPVVIKYESATGHNGSTTVGNTKKEIQHNYLPVKVHSKFQSLLP